MTTAELAAGKYVLLTTFRRSGEPVPTPVWVVDEGGLLYAWSATDTGKVKRIRRDATVRVAPCDFRGNPTGPEVAGTARLLDAEGTDRVRGLIRRKYGITGRLTVLGSLLRRGRSGSIGIELTPSTEDASEH